MAVVVEEGVLQKVRPRVPHGRLAVHLGLLELHRRPHETFHVCAMVLTRELRMDQAARQVMMTVQWSALNIQLTKASTNPEDGLAGTDDVGGHSKRWPALQ